MQIRRITAKIDTDGRDISGNRVNMAMNTTHLVSEVDIEYYLSRPLVFTVSSYIEIAILSYDNLGVPNGFTLPDGTVKPFGTNMSAITEDQVAATATNKKFTATLLAQLNTLWANYGGAVLAYISNITSPTVSEGASIVFNVALTAPTTQTQQFAFSIGGTATGGADYALPLTFSNGVTIVGASLNVPAGVSSFTATTLTAVDTLTEGTETVILTIANVVGTASILDVVATQSVVSISSPTAAEGSNLVFNIALSGATQQIQSFAFTVGGTATAGADYASPLVYSNGVTINGTNLSVPINVTNFTATTLTATDALVEPTETVVLTIGGITGTGSITDVASTPLTPLTDVVAFELPYGLLTAGQRTTAAAAGGYFGFVASRDSTATANYAVYESPTINGAYTKILDNQTYTGSGQVQGFMDYNHTSIPVVVEKDFPTSIAANTIGMIADSVGQQEFCVLNGFNVYTVAGDTEKLLENVGIGAFDTPPIRVDQNQTSRVFVLQNYAVDATYRSVAGSNAGQRYFKIVPKDVSNAELSLASITPISATISNRASQPYYPRLVGIQTGFSFTGNTNLESLYFSNTEQGGYDNLKIQTNASDRTEANPSSFYAPSAAYEAGLTVEVDVEGLNGVGVVRTLTGDLATKRTIYSQANRATDGSRYVTNYKVYSVKGGIRSTPFTLTVNQTIQNENKPTAVALSNASPVVTAATTLMGTGTGQERLVVAVLLTGTLLPNITIANITVSAGFAIIDFDSSSGTLLVEGTGTATSVSISIPYNVTSSSGKTLTVAVGGGENKITSTLLTLP